MDVQNQPPAAPQRKWSAMLAVGLSVFMGTLDMSIINVSLPTLVDALDTKFATIQWVVLAYILVITASMLGVARLGDMWDKKKLFTGGLAVFTLGSLLCGLSTSVGWLITSRAIQGLGAVIMQALGMAIIVEVFPSRERGRALGLMGSVVSIGIAAGPAIGGIIIGLAGWRWIFLANLPIGFVALYAAWRFLPPSPPLHRNQTFDALGAVLLFVTLVSFALGMTLGQRIGFMNHLVAGMLILSGLGLIFFITIEKRLAQPMIDLSLFHIPLFGLNLLMGFLSFITIGGTFLMPFFLELVKHYPPQQVGLMMMLVPAAMGLTSPLSGILSDRFGPRGISLVGLLIMAGGCLSISTLNADTGVMGYLARMAPFGIGMGVFQSPNNSAIMGAAPPERFGVVGGLLGLSRNLGHTAGMPIMGAVFTAYVLAGARSASPLPDITAAPAEALVAGVTGAYRLSALVLLASTLLGALALWKAKKARAHTRPHPGNV